MNENAALRASRDQQTLETTQAISMAYASGATTAQISAATEAEQRCNTDAHHALTQVNTLWTSAQAQHQQEL
eukprot:6001953-Amphidinium_carterae.1